MLSGKLYKPNTIRGVTILISAITILIAITHLKLYSQSQQIIYLFEAEAERINLTPTKAPLINIRWKIEPSNIPNPSSAALVSSSIPAVIPSAISKLNIYIKATLEGSDIHLTINLTDNLNNPIQGAIGSATINTSVYELSPTDKNGQSSISLNIEPNETIVIKEAYNQISVQGSIQT